MAVSKGEAAGKRRARTENRPALFPELFAPRLPQAALRACPSTAAREASEKVSGKGRWRELREREGGDSA